VNSFNFTFWFNCIYVCFFHFTFIVNNSDFQRRLWGVLWVIDWWVLWVREECQHESTSPDSRYIQRNNRANRETD
jgi:hypothetical protein